MLLRWESSSRTGQSVLTRKLWLSAGTVAVAKGTSWRPAASPRPGGDLPPWLMQMNMLLRDGTAGLHPAPQRL